MAEVNFYALNVGSDFNINTNGSGIGFFGNGWGRSIAVSEWNETTWITDSQGATQGSQINNVKYAHPNSGILAGNNCVNLTGIPNYQATLNIRFTHDTAVQVQNAQVRIYDRVNINNNPSGVTMYTCEVVHPSTLQTEMGSGDTTWLDTFGSGSILNLVSSPGLSGLWAASGDSTHSSDSHDWFLNLTASPDSVGSKLFALQFSCEYL